MSAYGECAMLSYRAWLESRSRFLLSAAWVVGLCVAFIVFHAQLRPSGEAEAGSYTRFIYLRVYGGFIRGSFLFLALILGLGGLQRERHHGTIGFTLSLPVSRASLFNARAVVGLLEIMVLAALPALLVPGLSAMMGERFPWRQSGEFAVLWTLAGWVVFAFATLVSAIVRSEYAALMTSLAAFYLYPLMIVYVPIFQGRPLHIHYIMSGHGMPYLDSATDLLVGRFPWMIACGVTATTLGFLWLAVLATRREDFI